MVRDVVSLTPRVYQHDIFVTCRDFDCLVVLPTGTGKTLIAVLLAVERFRRFPLEKVVVLAPTRPLVEQHLESFQKLLPDGWADMQLFTGKTPSDKRKEIWQTAEFVFSTPQCIANDLDKGLYDLSEVSLLVVDECHRCLKNYAYNRVAQKYKVQATHRRVLGLTASPGSDKQTITQVCKNLGIEKVEIRTRDSPDVRPYLQDLDFEKLEVDFPSSFQEVRFLLSSVYDDRVRELRNRKVLFGYPSKTALLKLQSKLMSGRKDLQKMLAVSVCSQALKVSHALELLETQTVSGFLSYLKDLFLQAQEGRSKGVQKLVKDQRFVRAFSLASSLSSEHPKLELLKTLVESEFDLNKNAKMIIFAQFRETVLKISEELSKLDHVRVHNFVGQAVKDHGKGKFTGLKQKEQQAVIKKFRDGQVNVLVATSIAEEGLDIPEVDQVVFYEPVPSAIRKIQRAGRTARLSKGSLKILITKDTRDQAYHYAAHHKEKRMHSAIKELQKDFNGNNSDNDGEEDNTDKVDGDQKTLF